MKTDKQHLPQDLITEILLRLPVKSLVRFKAVCKFWRSLISDPHFARTHFELAAPRFVFNTFHGIRTMDLDGPLSSNPLSGAINIDFLPTSIVIVGSCRGFLLLLDSIGSLYLWNPATRVYKPIPSPTYNVFSCLYGFGYDSSKDDYLVVLVYQPKSSPRLHVQFFSLRDNMWKYVGGGSGTDLPSLNLSCNVNVKAGLLFNETIHWLAYDHDRLLNVIIAFDLTEKRLLEIPQPDDLACDLSYCNLWVHGRFLSLSVSRFYTIEIWVMEKYKVHSSWTKTIVLSLSHIFPVCSTKSGNIVMDDATNLLKFTDKGEYLEHCAYPGLLESQVPMYTESILSLPGVSE
ncbi:F-box/kelch-repeat protein At3g23880-like [Lotus japonicus]|uniref:F-box/kelch-repeat protein At3g23880-like n=1 Tax=Lotus japonicus TaxID=34305 RepID=UPI002584E238|nr:F-box/kelch-repeat protein At3g23880-like [Lotus japonicus]